MIFWISTLLCVTEVAPKENSILSCPHKMAFFFFACDGGIGDHDPNFPTAVSDSFFLLSELQGPGHRDKRDE